MEVLCFDCTLDPPPLTMWLAHKTPPAVLHVTLEPHMKTQLVLQAWNATRMLFTATSALM